MTIITISRGTYGGGERLARLLAERLDYRLTSREQLYLTMKERYGHTFDEVEEIMHQVPALADFAAQRTQRVTIGQRRRRLFYSLQASLCELLSPDETVYHGHAGHLLLPGVAHLLRVRLIAPREMRIEMAMQREGLTRVEVAQKIDRLDLERTRWTQTMFGVVWGDPALFDVVVNLERMSLEEATEVVVEMTTFETFQPARASIAAMKDLCLSSRVMATLLSNPLTQDLCLEEVRADSGSGQVRVLGHLGRDEAEQVEELIDKLGGVKRVIF